MQILRLHSFARDDSEPCRPERSVRRQCTRAAEHTCSRRLTPRSEIALVWSARRWIACSEFGPLAVQTTETSLALRWRSRAISDVALDLVVLPGSSANADSAVRRVVTPASHATRMRFNGRVVTGGDSPGTWDGDFRYGHGVNWMQWKSGAVSVLSVNGFTPVPSVKHDTTWGEGSSFYVRVRTRQHGDTTWLVAEITGPNPDQPKTSYMAVLLGKSDDINSNPVNQHEGIRISAHRSRDCESARDRRRSFSATGTAGRRAGNRYRGPGG